MRGRASGQRGGAWRCATNWTLHKLGAAGCRCAELFETRLHCILLCAPLSFRFPLMQEFRDQDGCRARDEGEGGGGRAWEVPVIMFLMKSRCPGASMIVNMNFSVCDHGLAFRPR